MMLTLKLRMMKIRMKKLMMLKMMMMVIVHDELIQPADAGVSLYISNKLQ